MSKDKKLLILLPIILLLSGCSYLLESIETVSMPTADLIGQTNQTAQQTAAPQPVETDAPGLPIPTLPTQDYASMRYFEDEYEIVTLVKCFDGDTASFIVSGERHKARFLAIDTPEVNSPYVDKELWSDEAFAYTKKRLRSAQTIILEMDLESDIADDYGRILSWVWVDGELLNAALVREGLAEVKYLFGDYKYVDMLLALEREAQYQRLGIWSGGGSGSAN